MSVSALRYGFLSLGLTLAGTAYAEEKFDNYVYYPDGTYERTENAGSAIKDVTGEAEKTGVGNIDVFVGYDTEADTSFGLRGSYGAFIFTDYNVQLDLGYGSTVSDEFGGKLHVSRKFWDSVALGVFVGATTTGSDDTSYSTQSAGIEAAWHATNFTLHGAASVGSASADDDDGAVATFEIGGRYYLRDNLSIGVALRSKAVGDEIATAGYSEAAARADYRPDGSRFSVYGEYGYREYSIDVGAGLEPLAESHRVTAGAKVHFGSSSLKAEERGGLFWNSFQ